MSDAGINDTRELESIYINRLLEIMHSLQSKYIVWQEVFDNNVKLANDTVIHIWKSLMEGEEQNVCHILSYIYVSYVAKQYLY